MTINNPKPTKLKLLDFAAVCLASVFFLSYVPAKMMMSFQLKFKRKTLEERKWTGAGMVGSIAGALTFLALPNNEAQSLIFIAIGLILSIIIADRAEKVLNNHDDSRIVIDEWIGCWIAFWGLHHYFYFGLVISFILFRIFDILKGPWGQWLQKLPGGWGVVMDDVAAGIIANVITRLVLIPLIH